MTNAEFRHFKACFAQCDKQSNLFSGIEVSNEKKTYLHGCSGYIGDEN